MELDAYQLQTAQSYMEVAPVICHDPKEEFIKTLLSHGFKAPANLKVGIIDRIDGPEDRRGSGSGWYVYHEIEDTTEDGFVIGIADFGDWKTDLRERWCSRSERQMNDKESRSYREKREAMRVQYEEEQRKKHSEAAARAHALWSSLPDATDDHPYLKRKFVTTTAGIKITKTHDLIIPALIDGKLATLQSIKAVGEYEVNGKSIGNKKFFGGARSKGAYFIIDGSEDIIYVAEGYSTGRSINMATGRKVYVCFNCHNIYNAVAIAKTNHPKSTIIIAGDDDFENEINSGRKYAEAAAKVHNTLAIFPDGFNDFNDMHVEMGLNAVKQLLMPTKKEIKKVVETEKIKSDVVRPDGVLGHIFDYYNATSGITQHGFAVQTSLAICSTILGRKFRSDKNNYPSIYLVSVGKSGTGKEHPKTVFEKVLDKTRYSQYICGDGFTSAGAVFSTLLNSPITATCIDELGRYLEASSNVTKGNANQREANTKIMEAFGRAHSIFRPPNYSTMTLSKDAQKDVKSRFVHNPSLTILSMTTPSTLFKSLTMDAIKDGFVNRFLIYISDIKRAVQDFGEEVDVPEPIIEWAEKIRNRAEQVHTANDAASPITLSFTDAAMGLIKEFQQYANVDLPNKLDRYGMPELSGRSNEIAMRVGLIHALSRDPYTREITADDMQWAIQYVRLCLDKTIDSLKMSVSSSDFEAHKKELLIDIRLRDAGITWSQMQKTPPYSQHNQKYLKELMMSLRDAELVDFEPYKQSKGRPTQRWYATED